MEEKNTDTTAQGSFHPAFARLKQIADQLANVGNLVSEQKMVLQLVSGLAKGEYDTIATLIQQSDPLPSFHKARSQLLLEETRRAKQDAHTQQALVMHPTACNPTTTLPQADHPPQHNGTGGRGRCRGRQQWRGGRGRGRDRLPPSYPRQHQSAWANPTPSWSSHGQWAVPPYSYPTPHAFLAPTSPSSYGNLMTPTELGNSFQTMSLQQPDNAWYMDTGATSHLTRNFGMIPKLFNLSTPNFILVGDGNRILIKGYGNATIPPPHPPLRLKHVLHAPHIIKNLISVRKFTRDNHVSVEFNPFGFSVKDLNTGTIVTRCNSGGDLYPFASSSAPQDTPPFSLAAISPTTWHNRLGHPGTSTFSFLRNSRLFPCNKGNDTHFCSSCSIGKHVRLPFKSSVTTTFSPFDIIHADLWTSPVSSKLGHKYYLVLLDDFSHFLWVFPLKYKSQVFATFLTFQAHIKTQFEKTIKGFQCDNGREFNNSDFHKFCAEKGMVFRFSCPHTSPQNGKVERIIRTINNVIHTTLIHASLPPSFWNYALSMATYILNILPTRTLNNKTPTEILFKRIPTYTHLRTFGCLCYPNLSSTTLHKLSPRLTPCVFLGFPPNHRGYLCLNPSTNTILISRHVTFEETIFPFSDINKFFPTDYSFLEASDPSPYLTHVMHGNPTTLNPTSNASTSSLLSSTIPSLPTPTPTAPTPPSPTASPTPPSPTASPNQIPSPAASTSIPFPSSTSLPPSTSSPPTDTSIHPMQTRAKSGIHKPKVQFNLSTQAISPLPSNPKVAMLDPNWNVAMTDEYNALIKQHTWDLVPRPTGVNIIRCMWLFRHKFWENDDLERYKARLVVNGKSQEVGVDCDETFIHVVKPDTIRTVLSIAMGRNWPIHQLDVKNAFLHGNLKETVFMYQPPGFVNPSTPGHVCRLRKSLYGLKQAPRAWLKSKLIEALKAEFAMTDLGKLTYFLGISVTRTPQSMFLSQRKYAEDIINRAKMNNFKLVVTPIDSKSKLSAHVGDPVEDPSLYRSLAGALQYLTFTRTDIAYAVQHICLFMHAPR
ncbi:hypothetical protein L6452_33906 [Arctium lappa]|uniref:Uncharacterized protein n=1 Tax=Arctium lappa TaxID=4217 RepID=A0ACB8YGT6_ARCLA|nr:hypothetical protein L6452_33906 [Arctium lappa]